MDQKIGVYICSGCGIGESIDVDALSAVANEFSIAKCENHPTLCNAEGFALIKKDVEAGDVNSVLIAACSGRVKTDVFSFDPMTTIMERLNIREHVAWCQPSGQEDTQMMAEDYMRMWITKVEKTTLPKPYLEASDKTILVVGGGVSGLQSALDAAQAGYQVKLVEKEPELGGKMVQWNKNTPSGPPYQELGDITVQETIDKVKANANITVFTGTTIEKLAGAPGMFDATLSNGAGTERVGSVVLAAGWKPYDANKLEHLSYGKFADIITSVQLEEMAKAGKITCPSDGSEPSVVAFVQCAGSRDENHLPYCSAVCCRVSLKQAEYVKQQNEENKVFVFYKDMEHQSSMRNSTKRSRKTAWFSSGLTLLRLPSAKALNISSVSNARTSCLTSR